MYTPDHDTIKPLKHTFGKCTKHRYPWISLKNKGAGARIYPSDHWAERHHGQVAILLQFNLY